METFLSTFGATGLGALSVEGLAAALTTFSALTGAGLEGGIGDPPPIPEKGEVTMSPRATAAAPRAPYFEHFETQENM